jgi:hypothetical protein
MHHPLVDLMPAAIPAPERDDLSRAVQALEEMGWSRVHVDRALRIAREMAGETLAHQPPIIICGDEEPVPHVAVRIPLETSAEEANALSSRLHDQLQGRELDRPGLSISFWSTLPAPRTRQNRANERHR